MADDLMIEVTGSAKKAESALDGVKIKLDNLLISFDKITPSVGVFIDKLNAMTSTSKALAALKDLTDGTSKQGLSLKDAESKQAMYQARLDRSTLSMNKSAVASSKLAEAQKKLKESAAFDTANQKFLDNYKYNPTPNTASPVNKYSEPTATETFAPTPAVGTSRLASEIGVGSSKSASLNVNTTQAMSAVDNVRAYIDNLTPSISRMSETAQGEFNSLSAELVRISSQIDNQRALYSQLAQAATKAASANGEGSEQYLRLEKRMISADGAIDKLISKQEELKSSMGNLSLTGSVDGYTNATTKATKQTSAWGNESKKASSNATSGFQKTLQMMEKMFIRIIAFRIFSAVSQSIADGMNNISQASKQANASLSAISTSSLYLKNSISAAFMPILESVTPAITALADKLASLFNMLGMLNAKIFGSSTSVTAAKKAQVDYAASLDKTKAASDAAKKSVMGFDEINALTKPADSSSLTSGIPKATDEFTTATIPASVAGLGDNIKKLFSEWSGYAQPTVEAFGRLEKALEPLKTFAAKGLTDFYNDFLKPVGQWVLGTGLPQFFDITSTLTKNIDWSSLNNALDNVWNALQPFDVHVGEGLLWFYQYVISPIVQWAANDLAPVALNLLSDAIKVVDSATQALQPLGIWLYDSFLKPLATWTGGVITSTLTGIADGLKKVSDWISANQSVVQTMTITVAAFTAAWKATELLAFIQTSGGLVVALSSIKDAVIAGTVAKVADKVETIALTALYAKDFVVSVAQSTAALVSNAAQWVATTALKVADAVAQVSATAATVAWSAICGIATIATTAFGAAMAFLTSPIGLVILAVGAIIAVIVLLVKNWGTVTKVATDVWNNVVKTWQGFAGWFDTKVWAPFKVGLKAVGNFFIGVWNGIVGAFESSLNWLISGVNSFISMANKVIGGASDILSQVGIDVNFRVSEIPTVKFDKVPALATGGLVTAPTYSLIGEGKDNEAVIPLNNSVFSSIGKGIAENRGVANEDVMYRAFSRALQDMPVPEVTTNNYLDSDKVASRVETKIRQKDKRYHPVSQF